MLYRTRGHQKANMSFPFAQKKDLIDEAMYAIKAQDADAYTLLEANQQRLIRLMQLLQDYPSLREEQALGGHYRNTDTLLDLLCSVEPLELKLKLPSKAILSEGYMTTKIQHLKGIYFTLIRIHSPACPPRLKKRVFDALGNTIHTYLLYQLLLDVVLNKGAPRALKRISAAHLVSLWDTSTSQESIGEFFALIRSLWDARMNVQVQYGTLLGTSELMQLIEAQCPPQVLDHFIEQQIDDEEAFAFQEFLFGLSFEELTQLRSVMEQQGLSIITEQEVRRMLNRPLGSAGTDHREDPHVVYRSYKRRRMKARYRRDTNAPGPQRTAEEYLVHALLEKERLSSTNAT
ncbi:MAG: hypothetical protein CL920_10000 [Deltaproteobacteria bacterium]|nr:hypothetical protein [Deltaproteobacteria bacterium]MBU49015.1 hypothetical protein [Deltaproteobacteria bacterium]